MDAEIDAVNGTFWEESVSEAQSHSAPKISKNLNEERKTRPLGMAFRYYCEISDVLTVFRFVACVGSV